jgi:hypothetical protein
MNDQANIEIINAAARPLRLRAAKAMPPLMDFHCGYSKNR